MRLLQISRKGFSVVSGLLILAAVAGVALIIVKFIDQMSFLQVLADRRSVAESYLVGKIEELKVETFSGLSALCASTTSTCVDSGALTSVLRTPINTIKGISMPLGVRFDRSGSPVATGDFCLQVKECRTSSANDILDLVLVVHFVDSGGDHSLRSLERVLRRAR